MTPTPALRARRERVKRRRGTVAYVVFVVVAFGVILGGGWLLDHRNETRLDGERRDRCLTSLENRKAIRAVVKIATAPMASTITFPPDPALDDPDLIPYLERITNSPAANEARLALRRNLLAKAPLFRCGDRGQVIR